MKTPEEQRLFSLLIQAIAYIDTLERELQKTGYCIQTTKDQLTKDDKGNN